MVLERSVRGPKVWLGEKLRGHLGFNSRGLSHWIGDRWSEWKLAVSGFDNQKEI